MDKLLKNQKDIIAWLDQYGVQNYTLIVNSTYGYVVDVEGNVDLTKKSLKKIPIKFNVVNGSFDCSHNNLISLEGAPISVGRDFSCLNNKLINLEGGPASVVGYFDCTYNKLNNLKGCPESVEGNFYCNHNELTSLKGSPTSVGESFYCYGNKLTTLEGSPASIGGNFYCNHNELTSLEGCPMSVGGEFYCSDNAALGEYQEITDFSVIKEKLLSDKEKKLLSKSLDSSSLNVSVLKL